MKFFFEIILHCENKQLKLFRCFYSEILLNEIFSNLQTFPKFHLGMQSFSGTD